MPQPFPVASESPATFPAPTFGTRRLLRVRHFLNYHYPGGARDITTRLRLLPPAIHGGQQRRESMLRSAPLPHTEQHLGDGFGNAVVEIHHEKVTANLTFVVELLVDTVSRYHAPKQPVPIPARDAEPLGMPDHTPFRSPTPLTPLDDDLQAVADRVRDRLSHGDDDSDPTVLAAALSHLVYAEMRYSPGVTGVRTPGTEAWKNRSGVCQDYTHVLLALCRHLGLAARYVSGFLPGEGAMHAWAEIWLPEPGKIGVWGWLPIDPTHDRWVDGRYVTIAVGRDYADISPTSGTFWGRRGSLSHHSQVVLEQEEPWTVSI